MTTDSDSKILGSVRLELTAIADRVFNRPDLVVAGLIASIISFSAIWNITRWRVGPFNVTATDVAILIILPIALTSVYRRGFVPLRQYRSLLIALSILVFWVAVSILQSPDVGGGFRSILQVLRNSLVLMTIVFLLPNLSAKTVTAWVFYSLVIVQTIALGIYAYDLENYVNSGVRESVLVTSGLFERQQIFEITMAWVPQFEGFAHDPNSLGVFLPIGMLCGLFVIASSRWMFALKWAGVGVLALSMVVTLSRGLWASMIIVGALFIVLAALNRDLKIALLVLKVFGVMFVALTVVISVGQLALPDNKDISSFIERRFRVEDFNFNSGNRLETQAQLMPDTPSEWIFGQGARSSRSQLRGDNPENSYTGLLVDYGIIGLVIFVAPMIYVVWAGYSVVRNKALAAQFSVGIWLFGTVLIIVQGIYASLVYLPFTWTVTAVLLAMLIKAKSMTRQDKALPG